MITNGLPIKRQKLWARSLNEVATKEFRLVNERSNATYKYMNNKLNHSSYLTELCSSDSTVTSDAVVMCKLLSRSFASNFSQPDGGTNQGNSCEFNKENQFELNIIIDEPTVLKSLCPDGIPAILLTKFARYLVSPLTIIFQHSLFTSKTSTDWKIAKITPLYKGKGNKLDPSSYRPISLTSVMCKML